MPAGRPPKPIEQHRLHGTLRKDRHGPKDHPSDALGDGKPAMPRGLPDEAKKLWKRVVPKLVASKTAGEIDAAQLEAMCRWWAKYQELMTRVESEDPYDADSDLAQWRLEKRAEKAWRSFDAIASRFGLTPSDRVKLRQKPTDEPKPSNPLAALGISQN